MIPRSSVHNLQSFAIACQFNTGKLVTKVLKNHLVMGGGGGGGGMPTPPRVELRAPRPVKDDDLFCNSPGHVSQCHCIMVLLIMTNGQGQRK